MWQTQSQPFPTATSHIRSQKIRTFMTMVTVALLIKKSECPTEILMWISKHLYDGLCNH